jgi:hypothetical protein
MDLILGNKKRSDGVNSGEHGGDLFVEYLVLPKIALLVLQCESSRYHARGARFLFSETEVLLDEFFEPNGTILPHNIPCSPFDLAEQIPCE